MKHRTFTYAILGRQKEKQFKIEIVKGGRVLELGREAGARTGDWGHFGEIGDDYMIAEKQKKRIIESVDIEGQNKEHNILTRYPRSLKRFSWLPEVLEV